MNTDQRKKIVDTILGKIPASLNPVDFLHEILSISKESIYRRIRSEIDFTLEDIIKISSRLSVSIDELVSTNRAPGTEPSEQTILFHSRSGQLFEPQKNYFEFLSAYLTHIQKLYAARHVEIIIATNRLMTLTATSYDHLFKFYYYKWIHQTQQESLDFSLSDVTLSDDILTLQTKLKSQNPIGTQTYIVDADFLKNTILEIRYYYQRRLISDDEIILLQADLYKFLDTLEHRITHKPDIKGFSNDIYISASPIESSGLYCKRDDQEVINLFISYGLNIRSNHPGMCHTYRSWLTTLKKYASLVSGCNEALQISFLNRQRSYIENITNIDFYG